MTAWLPLRPMVSGIASAALNIADTGAGSVSEYPPIVSRCRVALVVRAHPSRRLLGAPDVIIYGIPTTAPGHRR
jgi:hypothetical protein